MESQRKYLKNWVQITTREITDELINQIENALTEQEIMNAFSFLQEAKSGKWLPRISGFSWNQGSFSVKLEISTSYPSNR